MSDHVVAHTGRVFAAARGHDDAQAAEGGFADFYAATLPRIYSFVRSQVGNTATAQEIVGRVFLKVYRHWKASASPAEATIWSFRIAHTTLIDYWRVEGRRDASSVPLDDIAELRDKVLDPEARYAARERQALLLRTIGELGEDDRTLLALKFAGQRTNREIAAILSSTQAAVSMRLLRALRRLRLKLIDQGLA